MSQDATFVNAKELYVKKNSYYQFYISSRSLEIS